ncbi:hypothetical protein ACFLQR_04340 [Verrucomicrobiota bacterium]
MKRLAVGYVLVLVLLIVVSFAAYRFGERHRQQRMKPKVITVLDPTSTNAFTDVDGIRVVLPGDRVMSIDLLPSDWDAIRVSMNWSLNPSNQTHSIVVRPTAANSVIVQAESQERVDPATLRRLERDRQPER